MPKQSKVRSKPTRLPQQHEAVKSCRCTRCGQVYDKIRDNFYISHSPLYKGNGGFVSICKHCANDLYDQYAYVMGEVPAIKRLCGKLDFYWKEDIAQATLTNRAAQTPHFSAYIGRINKSYLGKTYDDTLDEIEDALAIQAAEEEKAAKAVKAELVVEAVEEEAELPVEVISQERLKELVEFWGTGYEPAFYLEIDSRYHRWLQDFPDGVDVATEALLRQISIIEVTINKETAAAASGKSNSKATENIARLTNSLNTLLGSLNIKPVQRKNEGDSALDSLTFGMGIRQWENTRPIPEPDPDLQDVDNIKHYIDVWFLGHLCKMLKIKNTYSEAYEEEIKKYTVEKPELVDDEEANAIDLAFGDKEGDV